MKILSIKTISFYTLLVLLVLGQLQRLQITPEIAIYLHEILMAVWLAVALPKRWTVWRKTVGQILHQYRLVPFLLLWMVVGLTVANFTQSLNLVPWLYVARLGLYVWFGVELWTQRSQLPHAQEAVLITGLNILVLGLIQYFLLPDTRFLRILGWDDHYYRLISSQFDPNFAGMLLVLTLLQLQMVSWPRPLKTILNVLLAVGILLTYSRASYLALLVGGLVFIWRSKDQLTRLFIGGALLIVLVGIPLLPQKASEGTDLTRTASITARTSTIANTVSSMQPYQWLVGKGVFVPAETITRPTPIPEHAKFTDNLFVFTFVSAGLVGLLVFLTLTIQLLYHCWKTTPVLLAATAAILIHSQFNLTLFQSFVLLYFLGMIATNSKTLQFKRHR